MPLTADVCVLGGGPGGYVAALRAAALGAKVALVEAEEVGGVCLLRGCIPSKALLRSAEVYQLALHAGAFGVSVSGVEADYPAMRARKDRIVRQLVRGVGACWMRPGSRSCAATARWRARAWSRLIWATAAIWCWRRR